MAFGLNLGKKSFVKPAAPRPGVTAAAPIKDNLERMLDYKRSRGELPSQQNKPAKPVKPVPFVAPKPAAPVVVPEKPVTQADLAALTTDQKESIFNEYDKLRRQYQTIAAAANQQESLANLAREADMRAAERYGSNQQQDLMTQLAAMGMDMPSGITQVGTEDVAANTRAEMTKASTAFADALAKIKADRERASSARELGNLDVENMMLALRIQNARDAQAQAQKTVGGLQ